MKNIQDANEKQDTKLEKLGAAALSAEVKINEINETISPVFNEISQLKQDADSIKIQSESVILSVGELHTDISAVQTVNKEQDDQLEELHSENKNIRNNINSLIERAIPADNAIYQLKQDSKKNEQEINNLESAIELTDEVNFSQGNEIQQQGKMISELKADSDKLTTDLKDVRKKSNTTTNVANANRRDIDKHATKIDKNTLDILKNRQDLRSLENDLRETNERLDNGLAASAALNGLFQPYGVGKLNITAAMGGYQSTQAVAVGTGYRFNENIAVKTGVAYTGSNDVMYNMAFNLEW
ncbi:MAG: YadA-like family protein [Morganella morganii]